MILVITYRPLQYSNLLRPPSLYPEPIVSPLIAFQVQVACDDKFRLSWEEVLCAIGFIGACAQFVLI